MKQESVAARALKALGSLLLVATAFSMVDLFLANMFGSMVGWSYTQIMVATSTSMLGFIATIIVDRLIDSYKHIGEINTKFPYLIGMICFFGFPLLIR